MKPRKPFIPPKWWLNPLPVHNYEADDLPILAKRLQSLSARLQYQISQALLAENFDVTGNGPFTIWNCKEMRKHLEGWSETSAGLGKGSLQRTDSSHDRSGIYVFVANYPKRDAFRPFYVGISRNICARLRQHLRGKTHHDASLLYAMLRGEPVSDVPTHLSRKDVPMTDAHATEVRAWLRRQKVAILPISCPVERYALEMHAAIAFQTGRWNAFETH